MKNLASAIGAIVQGIADLFKNLANYIDEHPEILALLKWAISKVPTVVTSLLESSVPGSPFMTDAEYHKFLENEYESTDTPVTATDMEKYEALKVYVNTVDYYQDMNPFKRLLYMSEMEDAEAAAKEHLGKFFTTDEIKKIVAYVNETGIYEDDSIWRSNETSQMPVEFIKWVKETLNINPETPHGVHFMSQLPETISQAIVAALPSALSGIGVYMDSTLVGNLVTPTVTSNMARSSRGKKFTNGAIG